MRVNYVLVDTATLKQIDAYSATAAASDAFGLQDRVATWAASALALKLSREEQQTLVAAAPDTPAALEVFLEGRGYLLNFQQPGNIDRAIEKFDRAIALDPRYAPAYSGLGAAYWQKYEATQEHGARAAGARRLRAGGGARRAAGRIARLPRHGRARHRTGRAGSRALPACGRARADERRSHARPRARADAGRRGRRGRSHLSARHRAAAAVLGDAHLARQLLPRARAIPGSGARLRAGAGADARQRARLLHPLRHVRHRLSRAVRRGHRRMPEIGSHRSQRRGVFQLGRRPVESQAVRRGDRAVRGGEPRRT